MLCAKFGWNWPCDFFRITFFNFVNVFCQFRYYYPLKRCVALDLLFFILFLFSLIKRAWTFIWETWIPNSQKCFVTSFVGIGPVGFEKEIFKSFLDVFSVLSSVWNITKGCKIWLELTQWFLRRIFLNFINVFLLFCYYLPFENGFALYVNIFKSPSTKYDLGQI